MCRPVQRDRVIAATVLAPESEVTLKRLSVGRTGPLRRSTDQVPSARTGTLIWMTAPLAIPAHMYFQLKGAYGLRTFSALWRTAFLLMFCFIVLVLFGMAVIYLGLA